MKLLCEDHYHALGQSSMMLEVCRPCYSEIWQLQKVYKSKEHLVSSGNNFSTVDEILEKYLDRHGPPKIDNLSVALFFLCY